MKLICTLKQNNGAALAWVITTMVILLLLTGGILTMVSAYYKGSVNSNALSQAYFSARSGVNAVSSEIATNPAGDLGKMIKNALESKTTKFPFSISLGKADFGNKAGMGTCDLRVVISEKKVVYIEGVATVGEKTDTVVAQLGLQTIKNQAPVWPDYVYFGSSNGYQLKQLIANSSLFLEPIYRNDDKGTAAAPKTPMAELTHNQATNYGVIGQNVYTKGNLHLTGFYTSSDLPTDVITGSVYGSKYYKNIAEKDIETTITFSGKYTVNGGVYTPSNVVVNTGANAISNIFANKLTIQPVNDEKARLKGNVEVNILDIKSGATVTGNVKCNTANISFNNKIIKEFPQIVGDVTCDTLNISADIIGVNKSFITGSLKVESINLNGFTYNKSNEKDFQNIHSGLASKGVTFTWPSDNLLVKPQIENAALTALRTPGSFPPVSELKDKKMLTPLPNKGEVISGTVGKNTYYLLDDNINNSNKLKVANGGYILLYVPGGMTFDTSSITYVNNYDVTKPNVFIITEGTKDNICKVTVKKNQTFNGYIYSTEYNKVIVPDTPNGNVTINGGLFAHKVQLSDSGTSAQMLGTSFKINTIPLGLVGGEGSTETSRYYAQQYFDELPKEVK